MEKLDREYWLEKFREIEFNIMSERIKRGIRNSKKRKNDG